jgi:hypothetical protein
LQDSHSCIIIIKRRKRQEKECYSMKLDLLPNATVVDDAIRFVASEKSEDKEGEQVKSSSSSSSTSSDSSGKEDDNKESNDPDYDDDNDEKSDKECEEKQEHDTGKITMTSTTNQVF